MRPLPRNNFAPEKNAASFHLRAFYGDWAILKSSTNDANLHVIDHQQRDYYSFVESSRHCRGRCIWKGSKTFPEQLTSESSQKKNFDTVIASSGLKLGCSWSRLRNNLQFLSRRNPQSSKFTASLRDFDNRCDLTLSMITVLPREEILTLLTFKAH